MNWNTDQKRAIQEITRWRRDLKGPRFLSLSGAAGTGKTTVLNALRDRLGRRVAWAAMTGKAASRMREASGVRARTFHSVLYHPPREVDNEILKRVELIFDTVRESPSKAVSEDIGDPDSQYYEGKSRLLVLDESSMVSAKSFADIEKSFYEKVLFVGDFYQLPPISSRFDKSKEDKVENNKFDDDWSVFGSVKGPELTEVMRTSGAILSVATGIRTQQHVPTISVESGGSEYRFEHHHRDRESSLRSALRSYFSDPDDSVIITWRNEVRMRINRITRSIAKHTDDLPEKDEPIVVRKNVHDQDLMNGDIVHVQEWRENGPDIILSNDRIKTRWLSAKANDGEKLILVPICGGELGLFDGNTPFVGYEAWNKAIVDAETRAKEQKMKWMSPVPITYGYCLTAHMSQGSEFKRATVLLEGDLKNRNFNKVIRLPNGTLTTFACSFLYTTLTRAKERASLIVSD